MLELQVQPQNSTYLYLSSVTQLSDGKYVKNMFNSYCEVTLFLMFFTDLSGLTLSSSGKDAKPSLYICLRVCGCSAVLTMCANVF